MTSHWDHVANFYDKLVQPAAWKKKQLAITQGVSGRVLEVCCGTAHATLALLHRGLDAYAIDRSPQMVTKAQKKLVAVNFDPARISLTDVRELPFADAHFDYVLVTGSLGLLPLYAKRPALKEMARVCKEELRLLEPMEKRPGFYLGRLLTFCVDGMRPIPKALFDDLDLKYHVEWTTMLGIFSFVKARKRTNTVSGYSGHGH